MHHTLRYGKHIYFRVIVFGDISEKEKETWKLMVKSNSSNIGYENYTVEFVIEEYRQGKWHETPKHHKSWFTSEQDENNKRAHRRKLLGAAKDFAQSLIDTAGTQSI